MSESEHAHHSPTLAEPDNTRVDGLGIALAGLAIVLAITAYFLYIYFVREAEAVHHSQVLAVESEALRELRAYESELLESYGVVDAESGLYRIPLDQGIGLFVQDVKSRQAQGIPQRMVQLPVEEPAEDAEAEMEETAQ